MTATLLLLTFALAADPVPKVAPEPLPPEPKSDPTNVRELYDAYRYYGLPLPPKGSYLGKHVTIRLRFDSKDNATYPTEEELAFITDSATKRKLPSTRPVEPTRELILNEILPLNSVTHGYEPRDWLCFSAQAYSLGWRDAAQAAYEKGRDDLGFRDAEIPTPILNWLKETAWEYHGPQLLEPRSNHRDLLKKLERTAPLYEDNDRDVQLQMLKDLKRSVRIDWHRHGTTDDVIDGIVLGRKTKDDLLAMGFDAVPAMIRHLDDYRLTRETAVYGTSRTRLFSCNSRVDQMCRDVLANIASIDVLRYLKFTNSHLTERENVRYVAREATEWFPIAKRIGEKKWCLDRVLYHNPENKISFCNVALLTIIRSKYPEELPKLIANCAGRQMHGISILEAIAASRLPVETKRAAFREAQKSPGTWHPRDVIQAMLAFDRDASRIQFRQFLSQSVRKQIVAYDNKNVFAYGVLSLAYLIDDPECWALYRQCLSYYHASYRASLADDCFRDSDLTPEQQPRRERIRCMLELFGDSSLLSKETADSPNEYTKQLGYWELTLRDFAALKLATELELDIPWKKDRTPAEWALIRDQVRLAAEKAIQRQ